MLDAKNRFDVGLIPPNEVSTLEAQRSRERAQLIEATNIREGATIDLRRLIGVPQETVIELTDKLDVDGAITVHRRRGRGRRQAGSRNSD